MAIIITPIVYFEEYFDTIVSTLVFLSVAFSTNSSILFTVESLYVLTGDFFMHIGTIISITFIGILVFSIILCGLFKKYGSHLKSTLFKKQNKKHLFSTL